ncbi:LysR family transcriptional regulator [Martelella mediterranea]|uniref:Galactose-binding protein regulator n=1 Tax=Martelella mediterranea DSM 17316 TaxID=1122214 RepID=A0A1U9Z1V1_9HYPH|nr:LysR family transcriptional regulator [Martelella mediterranea]AQZ51658.1 Galactose-binding protein regulator [Martelella mediterranea DSM 17316]
MNLQNLRYLLSIAETGSMTRSAEQLNMTQPALSRGLAALEEEVGAQLFVRLPKAMRLTVFGRVMVRRAQGIFRQLEDAQHEIRHLQEHEETELSVGSGPVWLTGLLPRAINLTTRDLPGVSISVIGGFERQLAELVRRGQVAFILTELTDDPEFSDLHSEPLASARYAVVARRGHPLERAGTLELPDLLEFPWIMPDKAVNAQKRLDGLFQTEGLTPPVARIRSTSNGFITTYLEQSDALTFAVTPILRGHPSLTELPLSRSLPKRTTGIQRLRDDWLSPAAEKMLEHLRSLTLQADEL